MKKYYLILFLLLPICGFAQNNFLGFSIKNGKVIWEHEYQGDHNYIDLLQEFNITQTTIVSDSLILGRTERIVIDRKLTDKKWATTPIYCTCDLSGNVKITITEDSYQVRFSSITTICPSGTVEKLDFFAIRKKTGNYRKSYLEYGIPIHQANFEQYFSME